MANTPPPAQPKKGRATAKRGGIAGARKTASGALAKTSGTFVYRGLKIQPTFANDERSMQLEKAMREIGLRTHVLAE